MTWGRLITEMPTSEFVYWLALYRIERREQDRAQEDAQDRADAQRMARRLAGR
jgi:hypothetical protein